MKNTHFLKWMICFMAAVSVLSAQENFLSRFFGNFSAFFNTFYNAKVYFREAQEEYNEEEDKKSIGTSTRRALNKAYRQAEIVMDKFPKSDYVDNSMYFYSVCKYQLGRYEQALEMLDALVLRYPDSPYYFEAKLWIARCYYETDRQAIAYDLLERFLENRKNRGYFGDAYQLIGYLALQEGDADKALDAFLEAADQSGDKETVCNMYLEAVNLYIEKRQYDNAVDAAGKAWRNVRFDEQKARAMLAFIEIYDLKQEYDKAFEYVEEGLKDARLATWWGDFLYRKARIQYGMGEQSAALSQLREIVDDAENEFRKNKESNAWAKASYRLGDYYIYESFNEDSANYYYKRAQTKRRRCETGRLAEEKLRILNQLSSVNKDLTVLEKNQPYFADSTMWYYRSLSDSADREMKEKELVLADTVNAEQAVKDSLKRAATVNYGRFQDRFSNFMENAQEYSQKLINAGGIFLFDFNMPDTAMNIYQSVSNHFSFTPSAAQALYSQAYVWNYEYGDSLKYDSLKNELYRLYPNSDISIAVSGIVPSDSLAYYKMEGQLFRVETQFLDHGKYREGLRQLKDLLDHPDLDNQHKALIAYNIAWIYDNELSFEEDTRDSTLTYYEIVRTETPEHPLATKSSRRIAAIETDLEDYLAFLEGDSTKNRTAVSDSADYSDDDNIIDESASNGGQQKHPIQRQVPSPAVRPRPERL